MINTLKQNIYNKTWWVALISAIIVLGKIWGIDITDYIGKDWQNTLNTICTLAILLGISNDTTIQNIGGANNESSQDVQESEIPQENNTTVEVMTAPKTAKDEQIKSLLNQLQQILNQ